MSLFELDGWSVENKIASVSKKKKEDKKDKKNEAGSKPGKNKKKVNADEIQELYEEAIEGKAKKPVNVSEEKKEKVRNKEVTEEARPQKKESEKSKKRKHKNEEANNDEVKTKQTKTEKSDKSKADKSKTDNSKAAASLGSSVGLAPKTKLTPMQQKMMEKLAGSRFRWINEQLYTTTSEEAVKIMKAQPEMFDEYHTGFRSQVQSWPQNPVDTFVAQMKERLDKPIGAPGGLPGDKDGRIVVADMGCGEAQLALQVKALEKKLANAPAKKGKQAKFFKGKKPKFEVHSFDLKKANDRITVADIKNVPLPDESAHIVIFCLALMGTNFLDFIKEGLRILKPNGEIWIAEIKSRFVDNDTTEFVKILKSLGLFHKNTDDTNKMFIRMEYFKPNKEYIENRDQKQQNRKRFIDEEEESLEERRKRDVEGNWLLKPCIYKRR